MLISDIDRKHIEHKYHGEDFNPFNRFAYHGYDYDESTGLSDCEIAEGLEKLAASLDGEDHAIAREYLEKISDAFCISAFSVFCC